MSFPSFLPNHYHRVKHNVFYYFSLFTRIVIDRLLSAIYLIMKFVFAVLKYVYEKATLATLNIYYRKHKDEFKEAFFRLGIMDVSLHMADPREIFLKMKLWNPKASFFAKNENEDKISKICVINRSALANDYINGLRAFEGILDAVKICAKMNVPGTTIVHADVLTFMIISSNVLNSEFLNNTLFWKFFPLVVQIHFDFFETTFQKHLPTRVGDNPKGYILF